jgi:hypothetical protein
VAHPAWYDYDYHEEITPQNEACMFQKHPVLAMSHDPTAQTEIPPQQCGAGARAEVRGIPAALLRRGISSGSRIMDPASSPFR